MTSEGRM